MSHSQSLPFEMGTVLWTLWRSHFFTAKQYVFQDCEAFGVLERQSISVFHIMLWDDAQDYFSQYVSRDARLVNDPFEPFYDHHTTPAYKVTNKTMWTTLNFKDSEKQNQKSLTIKCAIYCLNAPKICNLPWWSSHRSNFITRLYHTSYK